MDRTTNLMGRMPPKENPVKAAAITSFGQPPRYGDYADPVPNGPGEMLVEVLAAGLHRVARGQASGVHYSSSGGCRWSRVSRASGAVPTTSCATSST